MNKYGWQNMQKSQDGGGRVSKYLLNQPNYAVCVRESIEIRDAKAIHRNNKMIFSLILVLTSQLMSQNLIL